MAEDRVKLYIYIVKGPDKWPYTPPGGDDNGEEILRDTASFNNQCIGYFSYSGRLQGFQLIICLVKARKSLH